MRVCGIAGFLFFGLKAAESVENTGLFRCATEWHTVCKNFWFSVVPCGCFVYQLVWENVLSLYLDKGVSFWGVFWEKSLQTREIFTAESCHIHL